MKDRASFLLLTLYGLCVECILVKFELALLSAVLFLRILLVLELDFIVFRLTFFVVFECVYYVDELPYFPVADITAFRLIVGGEEVHELVTVVPCLKDVLSEIVLFLL